jgi:transcriptional regulator with XRE-family HTH domain
MSIGDRIRKARKLQKLTQAELCEKCGIHINSLYKYENGTTSPPFDVIIKISSALEITIAELVGENDTRILTEIILIEDLLYFKNQELGELQDKLIEQTATSEEKVKCYELPIEIKAYEGILEVLNGELYKKG